MNVDVILTGVTGFVGRFVLLDLLEKYPDTTIAVIIRPQKGLTPVERFHKEIVMSPMFSRFSSILSKVTVIATTIEDIEQTTLYVKSAKCMIHCAANVKHYDPYESLYKDNVENVRRILKLSESLGCEKMIVLSTCYVHPRSAEVREVKRVEQVPKDEFYNDYTYTKWLGEEELFRVESAIIKEIHIVRLSCVGAPIRKDLQVYPFAAQAHLGIISLALRGYIKALGLTTDARLSIIPVDIAATSIALLAKVPKTLLAKACQNQQDEKKEKFLGTQHFLDKKCDKNESLTRVYLFEKVQLHQVCPPPELDAYHPNLFNIFPIQKYELGFETLDTFVYDGEHDNYLPFWYNYLQYFSGKAKKLVKLHNNIQDFVILFSANDLRFQSSLAISDFPKINEKEFLIDSIRFCIRTSHLLQYKKGIPLSLTDKFWHKTGDSEAVLGCLVFRNSVSLDNLEDLKRRFWTLFCSNQKFSCKIRNGADNNKWVYDPGTFDSHFGLIEFGEGDVVNESLILSRGLSKYPIENIWHIDFVVSNGFVTHGLFQFDHGLSDGIGFIQPIVSKYDDVICDTDIAMNKGTTSKHKKVELKPRKNIGLLQEVLAVLVFVCTMFITYFFGDIYSCDYVSTPSISTKTTGINKKEDRTFTTDLLWKLTKSLGRTTKAHDFIFCIPSVISANRNEVGLLENNFVPILLPVNAGMTEDEFVKRCSLLRSRAVLFIMYCIQQLVSMQEWWWLRDKIMSKVVAVVSSINVGENMPDGLMGVNVITTLPKPIPFGVTVISGEDESYITVRSHDKHVCADTIIADLV
jgi:thioester reductase-like protein